MKQVITTEDFKQRRQRIADEIGQDAIFIIPAGTEKIRNRDVEYPFRQDSSFIYLTGYHEPDAWLVIAPGAEEGESLLFCRPRDKEMEIWNGRRLGQEGAVEVLGFDAAFDLSELDKRVPEIMAGRREVYFPYATTGGWDAKMRVWMEALTKQQRKGINPPESVRHSDVILHAHRLIKDKNEIQTMQYAADISAQAHTQAMLRTRPGKTEYEIEAVFLDHFRRLGGEPAYSSIVGGGANACILHYTENKDTLRDGDMLLIDAGCEIQGYASDITRTFPVNGRFTSEQKDVYSIVLEAQLAAIDAARIGEHFNRPHEEALKVITQGLVDLGILSGDVDGLIESEAYKPYYMHRTGHWLGLDVHDVGRYKTGEDWAPFQEGMVITVEPGLYLSAETEGLDPKWHNIGIRIEDDVVITSSEPHVMTSGAPKQIEKIEDIMTH